LINFGAGRIFLRVGATDMRKSFDTLSGLVRDDLGRDPLSGDAFLFVGKRRNRLKILVWERSGFWVMAKRLASGTFALPADPRDHARALEMSAAQLHLLLEGIEVRVARYHRQYQRPACTTA
jgi:transposase